MPPSPTAVRSAQSGIMKREASTPPFSRTARRGSGGGVGDHNWRVPTYRDEVVILRTHKLGEADRIVTMLSRTHGKVRAVAKGVRRTSSRFGARLEPFMVADVLLYQGRNPRHRPAGRVARLVRRRHRRALRPIHLGQRDGRSRRPAERGRGDPAAVPPARRRSARPRARRARAAQHPGFVSSAGDGPVGLGSRSGGVRALRRAGTARHVRRSAGRHDLPRLRSRRSRSSRCPDGGPAVRAHGGRLERGRRRLRTDARFRLGPDRGLRAMAPRARHPLTGARRGGDVEPEAVHAPRCGAVQAHRLDRPVPADLSEGHGAGARRDRHGRQRALGEQARADAHRGPPRRRGRACSMSSRVRSRPA